MLTKAGADSSIFRFYLDKSVNERFLKEQIQPIFWYCRGVSVKPGVGEAYADHPTETGPDGHKAPLLVLGRFGGGRTLFSAIDDSWRWRFYTGEGVFDTYWVQQIRYLARSKKLGQRRITFTSFRPSYQLGEQVRVNLRILDPQLLALVIEFGLLASEIVAGACLQFARGLFIEALDPREFLFVHHGKLSAVIRDTRLRVGVVPR